MKLTKNKGLNILAHMYLSGDDPQILTGNFLGDFVKGKPGNEFPSKVLEGILLHRKIDDYTDAHEIVRRSKNRLRNKHRHFKGVIIDVFYDHFLATNWNKFSQTSLEAFTKNAYTILEVNKELLVNGSERAFFYMVQGNWLENYATIEGIEKTLYGISRRTKFTSHLDTGTKDLEANYEDLENDFLEFFPKIIAEIQ